jgi:GT2 family glycosyltransferase/glycosyltransferase involved in cell wall biosynthesis
VSVDPLRGRSRHSPRGIARRVALTYRYLGSRTVLVRLLLLPLRATPLRRTRLGVVLMGPRGAARERREAQRWYRRHGRPVVVVIPSYRDAGEVAALVRSIRRTTPRALVRIVVADDASGPEHVRALRAISGIEVLAGEANVGFAANVNRGLRAAGGEHDVVLLNSDMLAQPGWLAALQQAVCEDERVGIAAARLLYPDGRIQSGGSHRNLGAPEWFDHRYRFKAAAHGPAGIAGDVLAVTGACMYLRRELIEQIGLLDEGYAMAYEDIDYGLRAWQAGWRVRYVPAACLVHLESTTRGSDLGERERASQCHFWERWGAWLDEREVRAPDGRLHVVYVTRDTGVGGGHRVIFEHLNGLLDRGHEVALYTLDPPPDWFDLRAPVRTFESFAALEQALEPLEAIKVATWWQTAQPVWRASVRHGIPVYFVQDIETSYYPDDERRRNEVLDSYRNEFRYLTTSGWNQERLRELGLEAELIAPGIDLQTFAPRAGERAAAQLLAVGRSHPLKNFALTRAAWRRLPEPRPELVMFGSEAALAGEQGTRHVERPSDEQVSELMGHCTAFVQTSAHEGFCLPPLEAMATGAAVVCTDAHGNRDFCRDGENCLMPDATDAAVAAAIASLLADRALRERLGAEGIRTAAEYAWPGRIDRLEAFLRQAAAPRRVDLESVAAPELRREAR